MKRIATVWAALLCAVLASTPSRAVTIPVPGTEAAKIDVSGYVEGLAVVGTESSQNQTPQGLSVLRVDSAVNKLLRFHLELRGWIGGPLEGGHPGVYNLVHTYQNTTPGLEFREAFAEIKLGRSRSRIGIQQFAWGRLDGVPPTDILNPRDLHDPLVMDFEDQKIGVPALSTTYDAPDLGFITQPRVFLAYVPFAAPSRLPLLQERWFPTSIVPGTVTVGRRGVERTIDEALPGLCASAGSNAPPICALDPPDVTIARDVKIANRLRTANRRPPMRLEDGAIAVRFGARAFDFDWSLYHYTGPETQVDGALVGGTLISRRPVQHANGDPASRVITIRGLQAWSVLQQSYSRIHMTGFDLARAFDDVTVRLEGAYYQDRPYLRLTDDLLSPQALRRVKLRGNFLSQSVQAASCTKRTPCISPITLGELFPHQDAVEWGIGADTVFHGLFALVQLNQVVIVDDAPRLILAAPDTRFSTLLRRKFLQDRFEAELRAAYQVERGGWFAFPRVSYAVTDQLRVRLGYLMVGGSRKSLIGQFGKNDELVIQARYSF